MRHFALAVLAAVSAASAAFAAPVELEPATQARLETGQRQRVIVEFAVPAVEYARADGASDREIAALIAQARDRVLASAFGRPAGMLATLDDVDPQGPVMAREFRYTPAAAMLLSAAEVAALAREPGVARIVEDRLDAPSLDYSVAYAGALRMHERGHRGTGTSIAILDTGVDLQHDMFTGRTVASACFSTTETGQSTSFCPDGVAQSFDAQAGDNCEGPGPGVSGAYGCEHGTHVAGIALGSQIPHPSMANVNLIGVAPDAGLIAVQVFSRFSETQFCGSNSPCALSYSSDQIAALEWLYEHRAQLSLTSINMSLGGGRFADACVDDPRREIITMLREAGVATVIATGNDGFSGAISAPACIPEAVAVGGNGNYSNEGFWRDLYALGENINSAYPGRNDTGGRATVEATGTSMATPHVAGAFSVLREAHPNASIDQIEAVLQATSAEFSYRSIKMSLASDILTLYSGGMIGSLHTEQDGQIRLYGHRLEDTGTLYRDLTLTNTSGTTLGWIVSTEEDWIVFQLLSGGSPQGDPIPGQIGGSVAANDSVTFRISINLQEARDGVQRGLIWIGSSDAVSRMPLPVNLEMREALPRNDDLAGAFVMGRPGIETRFSNRFATAQDGEPSHGGQSPTGTLWWTFTPSITSTYAISAFGTDFDTVLGVYSGDEITALSTIASNDDGYENSTNSRVQPVLTAGTAYRLAIGGYDPSERGDGSLLIEPVAPPPPNDRIVNGFAISGARGRIDVNTAGATQNDDEFYVRQNAVWYTWTAPADGTFTFFSNLHMRIFDFPYPISLWEVSYPSPDRGYEIPAEAGASYYIGVWDGRLEPSWSPSTLFWYPADEPSQPLRSAVVPAMRTVTTGSWATAFATLVNPVSYDQPVSNCLVRAPNGFAGEFHYQTTDSTTNTLTGTPDTPVSLAPGQSQSFLISLRSAQIETANLALQFVCDGEMALQNSVNTFRLVTTGLNLPDLISVAVTPSGNGILDLRPDRNSAFAVAVMNSGGPSDFRVAASRWSGPMTGTFCETDPATGVCVSERASELNLNFAAGQVRTFTVFVRADEGADIPLNPATNRYGLIFYARFGDNSMVSGDASIAVRTLAE